MTTPDPQPEMPEEMKAVHLAMLDYNLAAARQTLAIFSSAMAGVPEVVAAEALAKLTARCEKLEADILQLRPPSPIVTPAVLPPLVSTPLGMNMLQVVVTPGNEASGDALVHLLESEGVAYKNNVVRGVWRIDVKCASADDRAYLLKLVEEVVEDGF